MTVNDLSNLSKVRTLKKVQAMSLVPVATGFVNSSCCDFTRCFILSFIIIVLLRAVQQFPLLPDINKGC